MNKTTTMLFILTTFFSITTFSIRLNPRIGRSVWRVLRDATPTPIEDFDIIAGTITIDRSGNYQLYENLHDVIVIIDSEGVRFDLNGYQISNSDGNADIITINSDEVQICNGRIANTSLNEPLGNGIKLNAGISAVSIEKVAVFDCANGIFLSGQHGNEIFDCEFVELDLIGNKTGIEFHYADENLIIDCYAVKNLLAGFDLFHSKSNQFYNCNSVENMGDGTVCGFKTDSGQSNLFQSCVAKGTKTNAWEFCNKAYGFLLTGTEEKTKIIECVVNETDMTSTVSAMSYGIHLLPTILEESDGLLDSTLGRQPFDEEIFDITWSPDSRYIAVAASGYLRVVGFDGVTQDQLAQEALDQGVTITSVDWSPDGRNIATGNNSGLIQVFGFDGSVLIPGDSISDDSWGEINVVRWSPDGKYIAAVDTEGNLHFIYFDGDTLYLVKTWNFGAINLEHLSWSPDGRYVAISSEETLSVVRFDGGSNCKDTFSITSGIVTGFGFIDWSPLGTFIAVCEPSTSRILVFGFSGNYLSFECSVTIPSGNVSSCSWSPDGKYIATCSQESELYIFPFFGRSFGTPWSKDYISSSIYKIISCKWSACGCYIASSAYRALIPAYSILISKAMYGPTNCFTKSCSMCDTFAYNGFVGTGVSGAGTNCFFDNTACNNEVDFSFGIPNVFYGKHNDRDPFYNIATQPTNLLMATNFSTSRSLDSLVVDPEMA